MRVSVKRNMQIDIKIRAFAVAPKRPILHLLSNFTESNRDQAQQGLLFPTNYHQPGPLAVVSLDCR